MNSRITPSSPLPARDRIPAMRAEVTDTLRIREQATAAMVRAIEGKIDRLAAARADRIKALQVTRSALARAILAGQGAPERHEAK